LNEEPVEQSFPYFQENNQIPYQSYFQPKQNYNSSEELERKIEKQLSPIKYISKDQVSETTKSIDQLTLKNSSEQASSEEFVAQETKSPRAKTWAQVANATSNKVTTPNVNFTPTLQKLLPIQQSINKIEEKNVVKKSEIKKQNIPITEINLNPPFARFFVIKSYSEDDVHKSIKFNVWASTDAGNKKLDATYKETHMKGPIYLFFSVNASGQFCGMAQMVSSLDYETKCEYWLQDKWNGLFQVKWIFIKDIPNTHLRHIKLKNNENKPVTNSRDTQEILFEPGKEMLKIFANFKSKTSILDDFSFYDKRQEKIIQKKDFDETEELSRKG